MRRFRGTAIFVSGADISDSFQLPRVAVNNVVPGFSAWPTATVAALGSNFSSAPQDLAFETFIDGLLARIAASSVGRVLLGSIPSFYPVLITRATDSDIKQIGECNASTDPSGDTLRVNGIAVRGHVRIAFPKNWLDDCHAGPGSEPHQVLAHELCHGCEMATHGGKANKLKITGKLEGFDIGWAFDTMTEFQAILITNMLVSENSDILRYHHHGYARMPSEIATSEIYYSTFKKLIEDVVKNNRQLTLILSALTSPKFNPLTVSFR